MIIKMLIELRTRMVEHSENFNKERENIRKYQTEVTELKNTITKLKNTLEEFISRLDKAKKKGSVNLRTRQWNSPNQSRKKKKNKE